MYKICKSEQSAQRQRELEAGLLELMLAKDYSDISISDLCTHLQIPRKSFYRYFDNKDGAFYALIDHTLEDCNNFIDPQSSPLDGLRQYFTFWLGKINLLDAMSRSDLDGKLIDRSFHFATSDLGFVNRLLRHYPDVDHGMVIMFLSTGMLSTVLHWHRTGLRQSPQQMADTIARVFSTPFLPF